jgi:hypothetical protein
MARCLKYVALFCGLATTIGNAIAFMGSISGLKHVLPGSSIFSKSQHRKISTSSSLDFKTRDCRSHSLSHRGFKFHMTATRPLKQDTESLIAFPSRDQTQVFYYDTTLRDGAQGEGISLSCDDKLRIALRLHKFGVHYIEGGLV